MAEELKALRRGRGVHSDRIGQRLGPELRRMCSVADSDDDSDARDKVTGLLRTLADQLPVDLGLCFVAAFGLEADARFPFYQQRLEWAAARLSREVRTVRRRVDQSIDRAAEAAQRVTGAGRPVSGLGAVVTVSPNGESVLALRGVVTAQGNSAGIRVTWFAGHHPTSPELDVPQISVPLLVDERLRAGLAVYSAEPVPREGTTVCVRRSGAARWYLVCTPQRPCKRLTLRVRFAESDQPGWVEVFDGVAPGDIENGPCRATGVSAAGEATAVFTGQKTPPAYGMGLAWTYGSGNPRSS